MERLATAFPCRDVLFGEFGSGGPGDCKHKEERETCEHEKRQRKEEKKLS